MAAYGAMTGGILGALGGIADYNKGLEAAQYQASVLGKQEDALGTKTTAKSNLLKSKYKIDASGIVQKKVNLTDELMSTMETANVKANQQLSKLLAMSVGGGVSGNLRARLASAMKIQDEVSKTNTFMKAKRQEADLNYQKAKEQALTQAELTNLQSGYNADLGVLNTQLAYYNKKSKGNTGDMLLSMVSGAASGAASGAVIPGF